MTTASLNTRYAAKLATNLVGLVVALITQAIIPRGLGPKAYGDFNFLTNFFTRIVGFLDMGTSIGFYTKISQRNKEFGLVSFYLFFSILISVIVLVFVAFAVSTSIHTTLWPDQGTFYVILAAIWGIMTWLLQIINKMGDAYGLTVSTEVARISQKVLGLVLIVALFFFNLLTLRNFFFITT
jgi:O-antigen/teichoic acid export membrane protein